MGSRAQRHLLKMVPFFVVVAASAFLIERGLQPSGDPTSWDSHALQAVTRECPLPHDLKDQTVIALIGSQSRIPEYNDCQRFVVPLSGATGTASRLVFDSLYAIYADPNLPQLMLKIDSGGLAIRVALIVSYNGTYASLGIGPGYSCLYLYKDTPGAVTIRASMEAAPTESACPFRIAPTSGLAGTALEVRRDTFAKLTDVDYPPVARWDWDPGRKEQYIGIKCGAGWCEVGRAGFTSSAGFVAPSSWSAERRRIRLVKGWYDEQILAVNPTPGADPYVSGIRGTVFPHPQLSEYENAAFYNRWRPVGAIALSASHPTYKSKLNSRAAPVAYGGTPFILGQLNLIALCQDDPETGETCPGLPSPAPKCPSPYESLAWGWARIRLAGTTAAAPNYKYVCVPRWANPTASSNPVPGAARWRWLVADETVWTKCSAGCCEVH